MLVGYLIARLKELNLYDSANIIITSDHGMDIAMLNQSIDLSQHVNISKFNSYGGLTQINIFPKNGN
jgi:arylsulfatase A-like enzyme